MATGGWDYDYDSADSDNETPDDNRKRREDTESVDNTASFFANMQISYDDDESSDEEDEDDILSRYQERMSTYRRQLEERNIGEVKRAETGGMPGGTLQFRTKKPHLKRRWSERRKKLQKREETHHREQAETFPVFRAPPNFASQMHDIMFQIKMCMLTAKHCTHSWSQPRAYQACWQIVQYCKELRTLINHGFAHKMPGLYKTICDLKKILEEKLADGNIDVRILSWQCQTFIDEGINEYLYNQIRPWLARMYTNPQLQRLCDDYEQLQADAPDMGIFQSAKNTLREQPPREPPTSP